MSDTLGGECTIAHNDGSDTTAEKGNAAETCGLYKEHTGTRFPQTVSPHPCAVAGYISWKNF